jgi:acetyl-CoA synthetase
MMALFAVQRNGRIGEYLMTNVLDGLPGGGLIMAYEALDRHVEAGRGAMTAIRWLGAETRREITYEELFRATNRFANLLADLGVEREDRVFTLLGRMPELYIAALGALKAGCVYGPLFAAFGPDPVAMRLHLGEVRVLVTSLMLYRRKVAAIRSSLPLLEHVLIIDGEEEGCLSLHKLLAAQSDEFKTASTRAEDWALLHFTSGTTGLPKGEKHAHRAAEWHYLSARIVFDLAPGDIYWCTADPGWVTGISYGILAPLLCGATLIVDGEEFDAERWYRILAEERVNVWYTAPTAIRMLMRLGDELPLRLDFQDLRLMASVGEPLNPEAIEWGKKVFGMPFFDTWWQTETGGIIIANSPDFTVRKGSMGRPLPGIQAGIARRLPDGGIEFLPDGQEGELVIKRGWPSMFTGYVGQNESYARCFVGDWYLSGDLARRDEDGYFWFVGRADDVIKSAGHLIGPFEVESALMEHPAVAEAGVIGVPDPVVMEVVKAFVALKPGYQPNEALRLQIIGHARAKLGASVAPRDVVFRDGLPRTRSGKIMRRLLKARELGLPEGDISTLEGGSE